MSISDDRSAIQRSLIAPLSQNIKVGIIGGTNIGKSSLFNCIVKKEKCKSVVENALFTTIDPYVARFHPNDPHIDFMTKVLPDVKEVTPAAFTFIDTPAIVEGAYREGNGLGVASIKALTQVDVYLILLKCFQSPSLAQHEESQEPLHDFLILEQEMMLMDLHKVESILSEVELNLSLFPNTDLLTYQQDALIKVWEFLAGQTRPVPIPPSKKKGGGKGFPVSRVKMPEKCNGLPIRYGSWDTQQRELIHFCKLLTAKEVIFLANISSIDYIRKRTPPSVQSVQQFLLERNDPCQLINISVDFEETLYKQELAGTLSHYQALNPSHISCIPSIVDEIFLTLQVVRWYMQTDQHIRCFLIRQGTTVVEAANQVDVYIGRNFIRADVITFDEYKELEGDRIKLAIEGKIRAQGGKYIVNEGEIIEFAFHGSLR